MDGMDLYLGAVVDNLKPENIQRLQALLEAKRRRAWEAENLNPDGSLSTRAIMRIEGEDYPVRGC